MYFVTGSAERVLVGEGTFEPGSAEEPPIVPEYGDVSLSLAATIDLRDLSRRARLPETGVVTACQGCRSQATPSRTEMSQDSVERPYSVLLRVYRFSSQSAMRISIRRTKPTSS
jgi:hypothetical protein